MNISYNQLSELTGKSYRTIKRKLDVAKISPSGQEGRAIFFDSADALQAIYCQADSDELDLTAERAKESIERQRKLKRENDIADELVAPLELLSDALRDVTSQIVSHMEALPLQMKKMNPALTAHDIEAVKKSIAKCRNACAAIKLNASGE